MWRDKGGLTSGSAECAPVRVFLAPSFFVFVCRFLFACKGGGADGAPQKGALDNPRVLRSA